MIGEEKAHGREAMLSGLLLECTCAIRDGSEGVGQRGRNSCEDKISAECISFKAAGEMIFICDEKG